MTIENSDGDCEYETDQIQQDLLKAEQLKLLDEEQATLADELLKLMTEEMLAEQADHAYAAEHFSFSLDPKIDPID